MPDMATEKPKSGKKKPKARIGRPLGQTFPADESPVQARLVPEMRKALRDLAIKNGSRESEEVRAAIREHLVRNEMWPPKAEVSE
jgi:hypothetical protein